MNPRAGTDLGEIFKICFSPYFSYADCMSKKSASSFKGVLTLNIENCALRELDILKHGLISSVPLKFETFFWWYN